VHQIFDPADDYRLPVKDELKVFFSVDRVASSRPLLHAFSSEFGDEGMLAGVDWLCDELLKASDAHEQPAQLK
jgi:hypothetical protein